MARDPCIHREPGGEVPAAEVEGCADDEIRNLGYDLGADEGKPVVCFGLSSSIKSVLFFFSPSCMLPNNTDLLLAGLKEIAVVQEERLHLVDASWSHEDEVEDGEDSQLEIERGVSDLPEGETAEEGRKNVKVDFVPHVILSICQSNLSSASA